MYVLGQRAACPTPGVLILQGLWVCVWVGKDIICNSGTVDAFLKLYEELSGSGFTSHLRMKAEASIN